MSGEFNRDTASSANTLADPLGQFNVVTIAGGDVRSRLRNTDHRLAGHQFFTRYAEVEIPLHVNGRHAGIAATVEPRCRPQGATGLFGDFRCIFCGIETEASLEFLIASSESLELTDAVFDLDGLLRIAAAGAAVAGLFGAGHGSMMLLVFELNLFARLKK